MRMHAHGCVDEGVLPGQAQGGFQVRRTAARADGHHALDASLAGALDHLVAVRVELLVIQMAVRIDQLHLRRAPMGTSSRKPASTGLPPSMDPAAIIPFDSMPRSFRGIESNGMIVAGSIEGGK